MQIQPSLVCTRTAAQHPMELEQRSGIDWICDHCQAIALLSQAGGPVDHQIAVGLCCDHFGLVIGSFQEVNLPDGLADPSPCAKIDHYFENPAFRSHEVVLRFEGLNEDGGRLSKILSGLLCSCNH